MKFNVFLTWPTNIDYPLWRKFALENQKYFSGIYIHWNNTHMELSFTKFLVDWFLNSPLGDKTFFVDTIIDPSKDWRNQTVNNLLDASKGEYIWYTEQDFFIKNTDHFFETISRELPEYKLISFKQSNRWHPACIFAKKSDSLMTRRDFGSHPPEIDHFGYFGRDLDKMGKTIDLKRLGLEEGIHWFHHNGLSQNYHLAQQNKKPNYDIVNFLTYNAASREVDIEQDERYISLTHKVEHLSTRVKRFL